MSRAPISERVRVRRMSAVATLGPVLISGQPRRPCEMRESLRQVEKALGEVRKPKCQRMEG